MSTQEAVSRIRGPRGTEVELLILGQEDKAPRAVKIVRDAIPLISVRVRFLDDDGYLWVRLSRFNDKTTSELLEALREHGKRAEIRGLVLDLRNNPGGLFKQSVNVTNVFLREGAIVSMRGRGGRVLESHSARSTPSDVFSPLVVLVNQGSASASEIVAGALQDHNRAVIVGEPTFGKGSVQKIEPLGDGTAIKLTIARYYTPKGRSIQAEGIVPDIVVAFEPPRDSDAAKAPRILGPRERDLSRHLENGARSDRGDEEKDRVVLLEDETRRLLERDNQLRIALQLVRGLPRISEVQVQ
jgi:carboxyl-terminal processing protease